MDGLPSLHSEITFVQINSQTDGRTICGTIYKLSRNKIVRTTFTRNRIMRTFSTEYIMFSNQNHFRIHKQVSESATYSCEEKFSVLKNFSSGKLLQLALGTQSQLEETKPHCEGE